MKLALLNLFRRPVPKPMTVSQEGIQARAIRHLIAHGTITARDVLDMGTNDYGKMFTRMRRMGLLYPADDPNGHRWQHNRSGHGRHKVHFWTRKVPQSWLDKPERRKTARGGKS